MRAVQDRVPSLNKYLFVTFILFMFFTVSQVSSTSCYKCLSIEESNECYNRTRYQKMIRDCPWDEVCAKIVGQTKDGKRIIIRDCYKPYYGKKTDNYRHSCLSYYGTSIDGWISLCPNDYCNHATPRVKVVTTREVTMTIFSLLILHLLLKRKVLSEWHPQVRLLLVLTMKMFNSYWVWGSFVVKIYDLVRSTATSWKIVTNLSSYWQGCSPKEKIPDLQGKHIVSD